MLRVIKSGVGGSARVVGRLEAPAPIVTNVTFHADAELEYGNNFLSLTLGAMQPIESIRIVSGGVIYEIDRSGHATARPVRTITTEDEAGG